MYLRCYDGLNVDVIEENALSFIMGKSVAMETFVTSTVSLIPYLTWTFMCDPYTCVQNRPRPKKILPPALRKVTKPRSNMASRCDSESN